MNILLLSAYDAPSHRRWRKGLVSHLPEHEWTVLTLPPRYFNWRVRGNSLTWSREARLQQQYDLLIATSMTDLSALRGMLPAIAKIPTILYFHENQFAYPDNRLESRSIDPAVLNLYSAVCADRLVFNSAYNRSTFFKGATDFLDKMPDHVPGGIVKELVAKSEVLPVPLEEHCYQQGKRDSNSRLTILWNHRWEYDKGPGRLLDICRELIRQEADFSVNLVGQSFRDTPNEMRQVRELLSTTGHLGRSGFIQDESAYRACLAESRLVLSTAIHEFQGLSVLEAVAAGCYPVVPDRLSYPEFIDSECRYMSAEIAGTQADYLAEISAAVSLIMKLAENPPAKSPDVEAFSWSWLAERYRRLVREVGSG